MKKKQKGEPYIEIRVDGKKAGCVVSSTDVENLIIEARRRAMQETKGYAHFTAKIATEVKKDIFEKMDSKEEVEFAAARMIKDSQSSHRIFAYTITTEGYSADFSDISEAKEFLEQVKNHTKEEMNLEFLSASLQDVERHIWRKLQARKI